MRINRVLLHNIFLVLLNCTLLSAANIQANDNSKPGSCPNIKHDLHFKSLAKNWDEGIPLGNGMIGALIWQKENSLRISLDRADLWDFRIPKEFDRPEFKYSWVVEQAKKNDYGIVQKLFDEPYDREAYPTKLPAGAIEIDLPGIDDLNSVDLHLKNALCEIKWNNRIQLTSFIHATEPRGWFKLEGVDESIKPRLKAPPYSVKSQEFSSSMSGPSGNDLARLGYPAPQIEESENEIIYHQDCSEGFSYKVKIRWIHYSETLLCVWTITTNKSYPLKKSEKYSSQKPHKNFFISDLTSHTRWWKDFWSQSSIHIPDTTLEKQYYRELYKFGSASRKGAPPITLQAVWTADNQKLPPWKGDFHNDLNTQLSYWPGYASNHLDESAVFTDWLWNCKAAAKAYTKKYFGTEGLNFPGVSTLEGKPMGGWIQYSLGPTVSAWLAHHFYLQWRYSMNKDFLEKRAYPFVKEAATYLDQISVRDEKGNRKLPLSSSPEINDNSLNAWFDKTTNFDLSLIRWLYGAASEMADAVNKKEDSGKWKAILSEWPELAADNISGKLLVAPGFELKESHRHFSHLMAIHPLGILNWENKLNREIIESSLKDLEKLGTDWWCGYSFSWLGNMYARARNGEKAADALKTFSECFCLPNSFHVNGDQSKTGKSKFTYRPFTLEGNFAFASGIQEMLMQSFDGTIRILPAVPSSWKDVSFYNLRAEGAILLSAVRKNGIFESVKIRSERGGVVKMENPFNDKFIVHGATLKNEMMKNPVLEFSTKPGQEITLTRKNR